jgi:hypothetical protein
MSRKSLCYKTLLLTVATLLFTCMQVHAQCKPPAKPAVALSPAAQASVTLNGKSLTIDYCAPSLRGRKVGDQIAPYGKVWRTGANTATTLHTDANLMIGDQAVPAGTYTLYTLPSQQGWKLIINKQTGQWGTVYNEAQDLGRVAMSDGAAPSAPVEVFKIQFEHTHGSSTEVHLMWGNTNVYASVKAAN